MPGINMTPVRSDLLTAVVSASATGDQSTITAVTNQIIRVYKLFLVTTLANSLTFKSGASTSLSGAIPLSANGAVCLDMDGQPWFETNRGDPFYINYSVATLVAGTVYYTQTPY